MLDIECNDTIVAKATPDGKGAIAIIRISGKESKKIIEKITKPVRILKPFYLYRTNIFDYKENKKIDDVLVVNMPEGKSYTGENMAEIYCHGGEFVTLSIINLILQFNVRYAEKGEFTYRAVKNKKMDLLQAESVERLINAVNSEELDSAIKGVGGEISLKFKNWYYDLMEILSDIEYEIDFNEMETDIDLNTIKNKLKIITEEIEESFNWNNNLKNIEEMKVTIIGEPNVGKSTLANRLSGKEMSIVSKIKGTTRDIIEKRIRINNKEITLIDTSGIGETKDPLREISKKKTEEAIKEADLIIWVKDINKERNNKKIESIIKKKEKLIIWNKIDLLTENDLNRNKKKKDGILISALEGKNIDLLEEEIINYINKNNGKILEQKIILSSERTKILAQIIKKLNNIKFNEEYIDISAQKIRDILEKMNEIIGENVDENMLDNIFNKFCIGK